MIATRKRPTLAEDALQIALVATCLIPVGVVAWLLFLSAIAGAPPPTPECKRIHDGEVLVASTLHTDGSLTCTYTEATAIYGRATTKRAGK